ncbi:alginate O-acetyltransferase AlgX-related protein, partial [Mariniphaga sediminis]|uniref:alginate O-acetyltransferase AlgX-related protein n=1 Tax=Mariniphaga sediminis TaxID=1628158 RepID=UPI003569DF25
KKNIYSEFLPDEYFKYSKKTLTDQFVEMLKTKTQVEIIDLRNIIFDAKKVHPILYHKMDNHWNDIGAYYAYQTIVRYLSRTFPVGNPHEFEEYQLDTLTYYGGSIARMLGVQDSLIDYRLKIKPKFDTGVKRLPQKYQSPERFPYPNSYERRFASQNDSLPRLLMINDSFGEYYYNFLPEHFSYSLFLFDIWEFKLHAKKVLEEKPDVFILSVFEGFIPKIIDNLHREENQIPNP